jgi:heptosyltransferase-2
VVQTSFLGDVVLTTPLLTAIRRRFPSAELSILCTPLAKSLVEANHDIDEIITDDEKKQGRGWGGLWRMADDLRARGFTMAISPHKSFRTGLLLFLAGIPLRIGFRQSSGFFFFHSLVHRDPSRHDVERNLSILGALGVDLANCPAHLRVEVPSTVPEEVASVFESEGIGSIDGTIVFGLNPGSVWPTKRWSTERYAELMKGLKERYRCEFLLFGAPEDRRTIEEIQERSGHIGTSLVGRIGLRELPCALDWCDMFITNDSGPMHVAVARGIPVVAIFCATTPALGFYPYSSRAVVVEKNLHCRPCSSHGGRRCPLGTEDCIHLVKADDVLMGVDYLLNLEPCAGAEVGNRPKPHFLTV